MFHLRPRLVIKKTVLGFATVLVALLFPGVSYAETTGVTAAAVDQPASQAPTGTTPASPTGPQQPPGADGKTYHLNPNTKTWENDYYIWDPATQQTTAKNPTYTYNADTQHWNSSTWQYDAPSSTYQKVAPPTPAAGTAQANSSGPTPVTPSSSLNTTATANTGVTNGVSSNAQSGDATVAKNTQGGSAQTGNAAAMSNVMNLLQSGVNLGNGSTMPQTFTASINGNLTGDMILDPTLLTLLQPAGSTAGWEAAQTNLSVQTSGQIHNNIALNAGSGNAAVLSNTAAGGATSGDANAVANVVNVANSVIGATGSFLGSINIYGNLDGDILLPPGVMEKILANNVPTVTLNTAQIDNGQMLANLNNNQTITNNVSTAAVSGTAAVSHNTSAGGATSGGANTNLTVLNLTGHEIMADNSLLVFVNVLGKWVGVILDAPQGTTAAAMGQNAMGTTKTLGNTAINADAKTAISNDVSVNAQSGNATVANNTSAGSARSGKATASANLLNISNSNLSLSGWLGILFINVFGSWNGSFGVDTAAGTRLMPAAQGSGNTSPAPIPGQTPAPSSPPRAVTGTASGRQPYRTSQAKVFRIAATSDGQYRIEPLEDPTTSTTVLMPSEPSDGGTGGWTPPSAVLGSTTPASQAASHTKANWQFAAGGLTISGLLLVIERVHTLRQRRAVKTKV